MKKHARRRMRAQFLQGQAWSIHEPALTALFEILAPSAAEGQLTGEMINERLGLGSRGLSQGVSAEAESTVQMVGNIAVLPVFGVLQQRPSWITRVMGWTATEQLERDFKAAIASDQVKAIVLYCDSPGGVAAGIDEVAATIFQGRKVKPLRAFVRGYCASACYYLASGCHKISATPSSTVGSIGTIYTHFEYAEAFKEMGIAATVIKHGERKGDGNPYEKLSPAARATLQHWVSAFGQQFEGAVARNRGISIETVKSRYGQGQAFLASEARERGLIDAVGTWEELLASLKTPAGPLPQPGQLVTGAREHFTSSHSFHEEPLTAGIDVGLDSLSSVLSASAIPAGVSAGPIIEPAAVAAGENEEPSMKISPRVRAALFAGGLIASYEASEEACLAALGAFCAGRGQATPTEEAAQLALFNAPAAAPAAGASDPPPPAAGSSNASGAPAGGAAANVQQAHEREMLEARQQGAAASLERVKNIQASGALLGIPQAEIDAAVQSAKPFGEIAAEWTQKVAAKDKPLTASVTSEGSERFAVDACLALQTRMGRVSAAEQTQVTDQVRQLSNAPLSYYARACLQQSGVRVPEFISNEELMEMAFAMDGPGRFTVGANYVPFNRPGSFPNLLSNLANKILDAALEFAEVSYPEWTGMWPGDLPDFKPAPVVAKGMHDEMDEVLDAEASKEFGLSEETLSYMILRRFSNFFALTPAMAANDDLGAFDEGLLGLEMAWQNTVNRLCLGLLTGNVTLLDGFALFDNTNHGNDVTTGGGAPAAATWNTMQLRAAAQRGIGGTGYLGASLKIALVPPAHYVAALQTFAPLQVLGEIKQPATDATINVYRGAAKVVQEAELQASSSDVWYGLCQPRGLVNATVIRAYFRGWGKNGRRQRWYDPLTKCWNFELEGRVGAAAKQYRTAVRNDGTA